MFCLMILGTVCFAQAENVDVGKPSSISRWATAQVGEAAVTIVLDSDNLRGEYDPRSMNQACADGACVTYYKWCEETQARVSCEYSTEGSSVSSWLRITAPSVESYAAAERMLGLVAEDGAVGSVVPLAELNLRSERKTPPFCRRGGPGPQCPE